MQRTRIKICGVCQAEDAALAARLGADAVGMVFHPASARNVSLEQAQRILAALPAFVTPVGLFVDASPDQVNEIAARLGLRHVQLHGNETPEIVGRVRATVIKAIRVDPNHFESELKLWRDAIGQSGLTHLRGLVLETANTPAPGGTGVANDWAAIRQSIDAGHFAGLPPIIAAGGLTPGSVADVIRDIHPWAVDVSSGVEEVRGKKSDAKLQAFFAAVRAADAAAALE